jgi:hemoglobin
VLSNKGEDHGMSSLCERLGGIEGITAIANDIVDFHLKNPRIAPRYGSSDVAAVKNAVATFFIAGAGGPDVYQGKDMLSAHRGMNIDEAEFVAAIDDAMAALDKNGIGKREKEEVLFILYGLKPQVVRV